MCFYGRYYCRDLKPENILLDYTGHIALCDFGWFSGVVRQLLLKSASLGLCKLNMSETEKTNSKVREYDKTYLISCQRFAAHRNISHQNFWKAKVIPKLWIGGLSESCFMR